MVCIIRLKAASKGLGNKQGDAHKSDVSYRSMDALRHRRWHRSMAACRHRRWRVPPVCGRAWRWLKRAFKVLTEHSKRCRCAMGRPPLSYLGLEILFYMLLVDIDAFCHLYYTSLIRKKTHKRRQGPYCAYLACSHHGVIIDMCVGVCMDVCFDTMGHRHLVRGTSRASIHPSRPIVTVLAGCGSTCYLDSTCMIGRPYSKHS